MQSLVNEVVHLSGISAFVLLLNYVMFKRQVERREESISSFQVL